MEAHKRLRKKQETFSWRSCATSAEGRYSSLPDGSSGSAAISKEGYSASEACRLEPVTYANFRRHVKLNAKYQRRLRETEETREDFLREFNIANIRKHTPRNVLASLWWLERRYPNQFALRNVQRSEGAGDQPLGDKIDEGQLRRYASLMEDFRRENESKAQSLPAAQPSSEAVSQ